MNIQASRSQKEALKLSLIASSSISGLVTFVTLSYFLINRRLHNLEGCMIAMLLVGDLMQSLSIEIPQLIYEGDVPENYSTSPSCVVQGYFQNLSLLLQFAWSFNIAFSAYNQVYSVMEAKCLKFLFIGVGCIIPTLFASIPLITKSYGSVFQANNQFNDVLCFIPLNSRQNNFMMLLMFFIPLLLTLIVNVYLFVQVARHIMKISNGAISTRIYIHLLMYPFILFFCQIWFILMNCYNMFSNNQLYDYQIWCYSVSNLSGLFDAMAYGFGFTRGNQVKDAEVAIDATTDLEL